MAQEAAREEEPLHGGPLFPWLDAQRGCQETCPLQGVIPATSSPVVSSYGKDSKERKLQKSRDSLESYRAEP